MNGEAVLEAIRALLRELGVEARVEPQSDLAADLGLDSVKRLALVVELENRLHVVLEPGEDEEVATVAQLVSLVERALARSPEAA